MKRSSKTNPQITQMLSQLETLTDSKELFKILYIDDLLEKTYNSKESISVLLSIIEKKIHSLYNDGRKDYTINEAFELGLLYWLLIFVCDYAIPLNLLDHKIEKIINFDNTLNEAIAIFRYLYLEKKFVFALQTLATHPFLSKDFDETLTKIRSLEDGNRFYLTLVKNKLTEIV